MAAPYSSVRLAGFSALLRAFSFARGLLALVGVATLLAIAAPARHEPLLPPGALSAATDMAGEPSVPSTGAEPIRPEAAKSVREQRAVAEFISRRYRVAEEAIATFVSSAYRAGAEHRVDPLLILAVVAVESKFNPVAESIVGAKGLMQVVPKYHREKLLEHGGETALLDPQINILVGAQILRECLRRSGETEAALQTYAGATDEPNLLYSGKVLAERARLEQMIARLRRAAA